MATNLPTPYFAAPPAQYSQTYMSQLIRAFAVFTQQVNNPGPILTTSVTLSPTGQDLGTGKLTYNATEDTVDLTHLNGVVQQIGFETFMRVKNETGSTIPAGKAVQFAGVNSEIKIAPYTANGTVPEIYFVGVTTFDMANNVAGPVTVYGKVRDINTTGTPYGEIWAAGDILYASPTTAGALTKVRPTAPNDVVVVAAVLTVHATAGVIMVRPTLPIGLDYGTFSSSIDQTLAFTNTATAISYDTTQIAHGVSLGTPTSRIVVSDSGFYQVNLTAQMTSNSSSAKNIYFWLDKNGSNVANTTRIVTLSNSAAYFPFEVTYDISLVAGDYIRLMWAANDTNVLLDAVSASAFAPAAPSVIVTVTQIQL